MPLLLPSNTAPCTSRMSSLLTSACPYCGYDRGYPFEKPKPQSPTKSKASAEDKAKAGGVPQRGGNRQQRLHDRDWRAGSGGSATDYAVWEKTKEAGADYANKTEAEQLEDAKKEEEKQHDTSACGSTFQFDLR